MNERTVRWSPGTLDGAGTSGLEWLQAGIEGRAAPSALQAMVGLRVVAAEPGRARFAFTPGSYLYNPLGSVHGGIIAAALDEAVSGAVFSHLPPGRDCVTLELKVNFLRALREDAGEVYAEGVSHQAGRRVGVAEGRVVGADGTLYAAASTTVLMLERDTRCTPGPERCRTVHWADLAPGDGAGLSGLDFQAAIRDGALPRPPALVLLGIQQTSLVPGRVSMTAEPGWWVMNSGGAMHGGAMATLLDSVMGCAVHSTLPPGRAYTSLEIKINYLRPVTEASGLVTGSGEVVQVGRQVGMATSRAVDEAGRVCAVGSTTCLVFDRRS